jgi:hypothetical protein
MGLFYCHHAQPQLPMAVVVLLLVHIRRAAGGKKLCVPWQFLFLVALSAATTGRRKIGS